MKKLFLLFVLTIAVAISTDVSAQSLVGKWDTTAGSQQEEMIKSLGGEIEESDTYWNFSNDQSYNTYSYIKACFDVMGVQMMMEMEFVESGTWSLSGDQLTVAVGNFDVGKLNITFSDPSLNSVGEEVKSSMIEALKSGIGQEVIFNIEFIDNNNAKLEYHNDVMPLSYTLQRVM